MADVDDRFLSVHPRTLLWWHQREQCRRCAHLVQPPGALSESMRCGATPGRFRIPRRLKHDESFCIDAREPGAPCGPDAKLFSPARSKAEPSKGESDGPT